MKHVLVLGGGAAGLAAAVELSRRGIASTVVECSPSAGGTATQLACKGAPSCLRCDACQPHDLRREALRDPQINIITGGELGYLFRTGNGFQATIRSPEGCEDYDFSAVILAVGAMPYDPSRDPRMRYSECADVLSSLEVERSLVETNGLAVPSTGKAPESMAIVLCVGSRDAKRGAPYCSKACCKYASKLGRKLRHLYPEMRLTFFFMDWRPYDASETLDAWTGGDAMVRVVRSRPSEIVPGGDAMVRVVRSRPSEIVPGERPAVRYATAADEVSEEAFDVIMLAVGMVPRPDNPRLAAALGVEVDEHGFLSSQANDVLVAGTCAGPKDLRESVEEGISAAGRTAALLEARP